MTQMFLLMLGRLNPLISIIERGDSYAALTELMGGRVVEVDLEGTETLNPWDLPPGLTESEFARLSDLEMDAIEQGQVDLIGTLARGWLDNKVVNQPIRAATVHSVDTTVRMDELRASFDELAADPSRATVRSTKGLTPRGANPSTLQLPGPDSNQRPFGYTCSRRFRRAWTISSPCPVRDVGGGRSRGDYSFVTP